MNQKQQNEAAIIAITQTPEFKQRAARNRIKAMKQTDLKNLTGVQAIKILGAANGLPDSEINEIIISDKRRQQQKHENYILKGELK